MFYGWWIAIVGCVLDAVKGGTYHSGFTLYFLPVLTELQLSRAATSVPFALARLEAAIEGPVIGYLVDRFDVRVILAFGVIVAGLGFVLLSFADSYLFFVLVFVGPISMGFQSFNHATMGAVNHWFRKKRGLAMSVVQTGQAIGGVVIFPLVAFAVLTLGWRAAAFFSGLGVLLLLPIVFFMRRSPESMNLLPDGERAADYDPLAGAQRPGQGPGEPHEFTVREAMRTPTFWLLAAFHALRNVPWAGVTVHLVPLLVWKGLDEKTAAFFVGLTAFCTVIARPLTGWLGDRQSKQQIGTAGVLLGALGLVALTYGHGLPFLVAFAVLYAFGDGINSVTWALLGDFFGRAHFAAIRGWIGMIQSLVSMPAAVLTGWIFDQTQSYAYALLPFIACFVASGVILWWLPGPAVPVRVDVRA
jgi:sugar phosphate permease